MITTKRLPHTISELYKRLSSDLRRIEKLIRKEIKQMSVSQADFDAKFAAFIAAFGTLITAVDALLSNTAPADMTAESEQLATAAQTVTDELNKLNPPAPVPVPASVKKHAKKS